MPEGVATPLPPLPPSPEAQKRLDRLRRLAWVLDRSIPVGKWRIGLDPILGLMPGAGDWLGALLSFYVLYEGAKLGLPRHVLVRMAGNILVESIVGTVPVLGDLFDFAWQANTRNLELVHRHYRPGLEPRTLGAIGSALAMFLLLLLALIAGLIYLAAKGLEALIN